MTQAAVKFNERQAHWAGEGLSGRAVYDRLAADHELPAFFDEGDVAAIAGLSTHAIKARRARGMRPDFLKLSTRNVRYPREAVCTWLADMFKAQAA